MLISCTDPNSEFGTCGNNTLEVYEYCDVIDGVTQFSDGSRLCDDGLKLLDIDKFECNACVAMAGEGACAKPLESCGNGVLDAGESCDSVGAVLSFSANARVCGKGLEIADIDKFECKNCVAVAGAGACAKPEAVCGNGVLDAGEACDIVAGVTQFADNARVCGEGQELENIWKFSCNSTCKAIPLAGGCITKEICGNGSVEGQEVCDASAAGHPLSGAGMSCLTYDYKRYSNSSSSAKLKCGANCTINDSACTQNSPVFRIATYNVRNLFDTICDSGQCARNDYEQLPTASQYQSKINNITKDIALFNADIVLLQEIEKKSCLDSLIQNSVGYVGVFAETGWAASIDVAVMVRGKVIGQWLHRSALPFVDELGIKRYLTRELLEVEVELYTGQHVHVLVTHLISKVTDATGVRRNAEALAIRGYLDTLADKYPDRLIVFGGDLNDTPNSVAIQNLIGDNRFTLSSADIPVSQSYTYNNKYAIDHLIYRNGSDLRYAPKTTKRYCANVLSGTSDHCALTADFVPNVRP